MALQVLPVPKAIYVCDYCIGVGGKVDLYGISNALRPARYPGRAKPFCVFVQLSGGLGQMPTRFDFVWAATGLTIHNTATQIIQLPTRHTTMQVVQHVTQCVFPAPGLYFVLCRGDVQQYVRWRCGA